MDWQNTIMIILTVLLLCVWLPALVISVRKVMRNERKKQIINRNNHGSKA